MNEWQLINPSDSMSFLTDSYRVATAVAMMLGSGRTPAESGDQKVPAFLFSSAEEWFKETFNQTSDQFFEEAHCDKRVMEALGTLVYGCRDKYQESGKSLDEWNDSQRSSLSDYHAYAKKLVKQMKIHIDENQEKADLVNKKVTEPNSRYDIPNKPNPTAEQMEWMKNGLSFAMHRIYSAWESGFAGESALITRSIVRVLQNIRDESLDQEVFLGNYLAELDDSYFKYLKEACESEEESELKEIIATLKKATDNFTGDITIKPETAKKLFKALNEFC